MKINRILIMSAIFLTAFTGYYLAHGIANVYIDTSENIQYLVKPLGRAEYSNLGTVDLNGVKANLIMLKVKTLFLEITEMIYSDPESLLPYKTERTTSGFWIKEYKTEEYDQKNFTVVVKQFKKKKLINEQIIKSDGPIQNVNLLPFYLRKEADPKIGWQITAIVPDERKLSKFDLKLFSIDQITVPAGSFQAYHFKSIPAKYEIWIDKKSPRIPVKITIKSIVDCSLSMEKYSLQ